MCKKRDLKEPILVLVDYGFKINILSKKIYMKNKWLIDTNHGWILRFANDERSSFYGVCLIVGIKINNVEVEQNFIMQNQRSYLIILEQPYINIIRMENEVLYDGLHYTRIHSHDY